MIILNDLEFTEALFGGFGWIVAIFFIRNGIYKQYSNINMALVGGFSWGIFYSIRKIGMNVYRHLKFEYDLPDKHFKLKVPNPKIKYILITLLTFLLVLFIVFSNRAKSSMDIFKKFDGKEIPVIIYFILLGYLVYDSNDTFIYQGNPTQIK